MRKLIWIEAKCHRRKRGKGCVFTDCGFSIRKPAANGPIPFGSHVRLDLKTIIFGILISSGAKRLAKVGSLFR